MKQLDDLVAKINSLNTAIYVKGKEYPGNNPYILNEINNMLEAGRMKKRYGSVIVPTETLEPEDLKWDDPRLRFDEDGNCLYLFYDELERMGDDIYRKHDDLSDENNERIALEERCIKENLI